MSDFTISPIADGRGLKLVGELDAATVGELMSAVRRVTPHHELVLDLSQLLFLDSRGTHCILTLASERNGDGPVVILDPSPAVSRVLQIVGIDQFPGIQLRRSCD